MTAQWSSVFVRPSLSRQKEHIQKKEKPVPHFLFIGLFKEALTAVAWARGRCEIGVRGCITHRQLQGLVAPSPCHLTAPKQNAANLLSCPNKCMWVAPPPSAVAEILNHDWRLYWHNGDKDLNCKLPFIEINSKLFVFYIFNFARANERRKGLNHVF